MRGTITEKKADKRARGGLAFLAALTFGMLSLAAPVLAEEQSQESLSELFYTYTGDNVIGEYYDPSYVLSTWQLQAKSYDAFLALKETDLNYDGTNELLAIRLKPDTAQDGTTENNLVAEIYQRQDNSLQRTASYTLAENILNLSESRVDVFFADAQSGRILCCEAKDSATLLANGIRWSLRGVGYDGSGFYEVANVHLEGSSFTDEQINTCMQAAGSLGIYPSEVVWTPLLEQVTGYERLCLAYRYMTVDVSEVNSFLQGGTGESLQYGETRFKNYANDGIENKLPGEFATVLGETQAQSEASGQTAYSFAGDYVIPDSSSRYITEEDLASLSEDEILLARNEIYAKHGRKFNNVALNEYFSGKSWYTPTVEGEDFTEEYASQVFNDFEIKNISTIVNYEQAHGLNDFE